MSVSLDDIWSEPLAEEPSLSPPPQGLGDDDDNVFRPTKRRRSTLFLGGSEDEDEDTSRKGDRPASNARPEIDSLFEDLEDLSTSRLSKPSRPFDLAARRREAQARAEKEAPSSSFPQYAVQSSSPPRDVFDGDGKGGIGSRKDEDAGAGKKRKIAKLDEDRLLGKDGLPALVQVCKDFKPRGKGHELADLNRLFSLYQFWSHKMYPRTQFSDTVNRVEKLCHSKRMISALSGWRDQVHGTINGKKVPEDDDIDMRSDNGDGDASGDEQRRERIEEDVFGPRRDNTASSSSRAPSEAAPDSPIPRPPSSASASEHNNSGDMAMDDDDPFDFDALLRQEEEMRLAQVATAKAPAVKAKGGMAGRDFTFDEEEEEMWAELHDGAFEETPAPAHTSSLAAKAPATTNATSNTSSGDEEDPWDVLDEIENEQKQAKLTASAVHHGPAVLPPPEPEVAPSTGTVHNGVTKAAVVTPAKSVSSNDDDWDDMYV